MASLQLSALVPQVVLPCWMTLPLPAELCAGTGDNFSQLLLRLPKYEPLQENGICKI